MPRPTRPVQRTAQRTIQRTARNDDLTDREMLANVKDALDADGWATTTDIARACGFTGTGRKSQTPAMKVASRLAYMRDGGLLESMKPSRFNGRYHEPGDRDTRWRLTPIGDTILAGKLTKAIENALERMDPGQQVLLLRGLMQRGFVGADDAVAFVNRREAMHHLHQRKLMVRGR